MQGILVGILILGAIAYVVYEIYKRFFSKKDHCDGCAMGKDQIKNS